MSLSRPIAILDSGLGGLTVGRALRRVLPGEDLVYFGDTARVPYGLKSPETVRCFVRQIIAYLRPFDPKHIVIACNTATALALPQMRREFPELSIRRAPANPSGFFEALWLKSDLLDFLRGKSSQVLFPGT